MFCCGRWADVVLVVNVNGWPSSFALMSFSYQKKGDSSEIHLLDTGYISPYPSTFI